MSQSKNVIITGATGYIGQNLIPLLLDCDYKITAIGRDVNKAKKFKWYNRVKFKKIDIKKNFKSINIKPGTGLIHLAWDGLSNYKSILHSESRDWSYNLIEFLISKGLSKVLITGTCLEYGLTNGLKKSSMKTLPSSEYSREKELLRNQILNLRQKYSFNFQWARLFYIYGNNQNSNTLFSQLEEAIKKKRLTFNMSPGDQIRDYLHINEVIRQLLGLYSSDKEGVYNICSGKPEIIKRMVEKNIKQSKSNLKLNFGYYPYNDYEPNKFWGQRDLGETVLLPSLPNAPLREKDNKKYLAPVTLEFNTKLKFLENKSFNVDLINYSKNYENSQAFSNKFRTHMLEVLELLKKNFAKNSRIIEIGCGQGDFLEMVQSDGYFKIRGYDASYNGRNKLIKKKYLNKNTKLKADLVVLRHVLEHIAKPYDFLLMLKKIFGKTKIFIEVPNYDWIVSNQSFFDITYEHVNYFSKKALTEIFHKRRSKSNLIFDGQYQYILSSLNDLNQNFDKLYKSNHWKSKSIRSIFPKMINKIKYLDKISKNSSIYIWGAATKGCLFLSHCSNLGIIINRVKFAIDQNPNKVGKYLQGSMVKIETKKKFFRNVKPNDLLLISNPNYRDEIIKEIRDLNIKNIIIKNL